METNILLNRRARLCRLSFSEEPSSRWFPNVLERTHGRGRDLHSDTLRFPGRGFSIYWTPAVWASGRPLLAYFAWAWRHARTPSPSRSRLRPGQPSQRVPCKRGLHRQHTGFRDTKGLQGTERGAPDITSRQPSFAAALGLAREALSWFCAGLLIAPQGPDTVVLRSENS